MLLLSEYVDIEDSSPGADHAELYVVDGCELLEGGQGDLGDMVMSHH